MRTIAIAAGLLAMAAAAAAAEPEKKAATPAAKAPAAHGARSRLPHATKPSKVPPLEKFSCRTGPNDEQVRLIVEAVKGRAMEFAFYSRLGTRVCSIHSRRGDGLTQWDDAAGAGGKAVVKLLTGSAALEYEPGHVKVTFTDVNRMQYCGMYGELNGQIEAVMKKPDCDMKGLFDGTVDKDQIPPPAAAPGD